MSKSRSVRVSLRARTTDEGLGLCSLNRKVGVRFSSLCLIQKIVFIRRDTDRYALSGSGQDMKRGAREYFGYETCATCSLDDVGLGCLPLGEVDRTAERRRRTPGASLSRE